MVLEGKAADTAVEVVFAVAVVADMVFEVVDSRRMVVGAYISIFSYTI